MGRRSDWPERLAAEIEAAAKRLFKYGRHDCCLFAAGCVRAMTGVDPAKGLRGYGTKEGADKVLKTRGAGTLLNTAQRALKQVGRPVPVGLARRGDLVYARIPTPEGEMPALGICLGAEAAIASDGLVMHPMSVCRRAWAVGWPPYTKVSGGLPPEALAKGGRAKGDA